MAKNQQKASELMPKKQRRRLRKIAEVWGVEKMGEVLARHYEKVAEEFSKENNHDAAQTRRDIAFKLRQFRPAHK